MPLEDDFCDVVRKARFGLGLAPNEVAERAGLLPLRLEALEAGQTASAAEAERLAAALGLRAAPLRDLALGRWSPAPVRCSGEAEVTPVFAPDVGAFAYAVRSAEGPVLVDCGGAVRELLAALGAQPRAVLLTHGHHDHVGGLEALPPGTSVYAHPELAATIPAAHPLLDGQTVCGLRAMYSPGHSADMLCFEGFGAAFTGDTVFAGSLGRARSAAAYPVLLESARRILALPPETALFCGHGPASRVAWEREHNAFPVA